MNEQPRDDQPSDDQPRDDRPRDGQPGQPQPSAQPGSAPPQRAPRTRRPLTGRRIVRILAWTTLGVVLVCAALGGYLFWRLNHNIRTVNISAALGSDRPAASTKGAMNILVLGSDSRSGANGRLAGGATDGTARSDTAIIVHVNQSHSRADVVSIPRDTLVTRPSCTSTGATDRGAVLPAASGVMFNTAYEVGGPACAVKTVESMTDLRMDHFVEVDFAGFAKLIDSLGGVTVTTTVPIDDDLSGLHLAAGTHHLDGTDALAFVRTRHGVGDGSDLGRIELQQQMIRSIMTQAESLDLLGDPGKLYDIADTATSSLTTDSDLGSITSLISFAEALKGISAADVTSVTMPTMTAPSDPNRLVPLNPLVTELWTALAHDQAVPASVLNVQITNPADSTTPTPTPSARPSSTAPPTPSAAASGAGPVAGAGQE
ncbi:LytR family transcriptional regulator [Streptacidiphilus sp. PB12-B1b]|uniref:LCP family protein n=1 Tax=Streptacidiphilus sp. PB12-B1b TaxID=2705012 RepID=UPI0015FB2E1C|nr:LCP family protein [Streptacidiphilus sp. PB12-B1b]QMU79160.1 LytR family transcriptional regulator [Streptacidiphilus sp. PB12-B1b]